MSIPWLTETRPQALLDDLLLEELESLVGDAEQPRDLEDQEDAGELVAEDQPHPLEAVAAGLAAAHGLVDSRRTRAGRRSVAAAANRAQSRTWAVVLCCSFDENRDRTVPMSRPRAIGPGEAIGERGVGIEPGEVDARAGCRLGPDFVHEAGDLRTGRARDRQFYGHETISSACRPSRYPGVLAGVSRRGDSGGPFFCPLQGRGVRTRFARGECASESGTGPRAGVSADGSRRLPVPVRRAT